MFLVVSFLCMIFFLLGTFFLTAVASAFRRIHKRDSKKQIIAAGKWFFYRPFHLYFFPEQEYEGLFFATICAQNVTRYCYIASAVVFLLATPLFQHHVDEALTTNPQIYEFTFFWIALTCLALLLISFIIGEYLPRILGLQVPEKVMRFCTPFSSIFMFIAFPLTFLFLKISQSFSRTIYFDHLNEPEAEARQEIIDIIQDADVSPRINRHEKKILESVLSFGQRNAREVMVPRVNVFSIPAETPIKEAAEMIAAEGYSRTPIYRNTIDEIIGVVMYKDILTKFREYQKNNDPNILAAPVETIHKPILYTPESKKISNLLQEFRKKQVHLAIVVDEYGGTEGIVTIEDILEEIVGDIADEYDEDEAMYVAQPDGSWIVDAQLGIFDAEEIMEIEIPQEGEYDTIAGYVFHCAGTIPAKGFIIHQDEFELEILSSNERSVEKVRIKPLHPKTALIKKDAKEE